jgi:hypothetical protein
MIKQYSLKPSSLGMDCHQDMVEDEEGQYILASDYSALAAELAAATAENDRNLKSVGWTRIVALEDRVKELEAALTQITKVGPLGVDTYPECYRRIQKIAGTALDRPINPTAQHASECPKLYGGECDCNPTSFCQRAGDYLQAAEDRELSEYETPLPTLAELEKEAKTMAVSKDITCPYCGNFHHPKNPCLQGGYSAINKAWTPIKTNAELEREAFEYWYNKELCKPAFLSSFDTEPNGKNASIAWRAWKAAAQYVYTNTNIKQ